MRHGREVARNVHSDSPGAGLGGLFEARGLLFFIVVETSEIRIGPLGFRGFRNPLHHGSILDHVAKGLGVVQNVVGKGHAEFGKLLLDLVKTFLLGSFQTNTAKLHFEKRVLQSSATLLLQKGIAFVVFGFLVPLFLNGRKCVIQWFGLRKFRKGFNNLGLVGFVGLPECVPILDAVQMSGHPPDVAQRMLHPLNDGKYLFVIGTLVALQFFFELCKVRFQFGQEFFDGWAQVFGFQTLEFGEGILLQKGIDGRNSFGGGHSQQCGGGGGTSASRR
mmetsp:Transcript_13853/g.34807  ORF Transcript_13853/g.34807 Transcript_13853/m.34807 type:complete len:276 (+) Transcript_13853:1509-2336(+)